MNLPADAKRVFKGIIFDVYQWQQQMFDGSYKTFEMLKRPNNVEVIAVSGDRIFLTRQSQPNKHDFYGLFGGRAEAGEAPIDTAKREMLEESGMSSDNLEIFKVFRPIHKIDYEIHTFIARDCRKVADQQLDPGEQIEVISCSFDEFIDIILSDKFWGDHLVLEILRMKDQGRLTEFRRKLFG